MLQPRGGMPCPLLSLASLSGRLVSLSQIGAACFSGVLQRGRDEVNGAWAPTEAEVRVF
eukprot:COSAG06_NODE_2440_length_6872_cov_135.458586_7_plen_59_part_00